MRRWWLLILVALLTVSASSAQEDSRSFYLGFTPFPYEVSFDAIDFTYTRIAQDADLIVHHFDNGVPWVEALAGEPYHRHMLDDWALRRSRTPDGHKVLVTVTPINWVRTGLAGYHGDAEDMPLPPPWNSYGFDHPDVARAFLRYCEDIIAYFEPDYFLFGIEVNLLMKNAPELWPAYLALHRQVYTALKSAHPDLPVMVSLTGIDLLPGLTDADHAEQMQALSDVIDTTDILALSIYPYMTAYLTESLPPDLFVRLAALTDKPLAVSETGYPAQSFAIDIGGGQRLQFESDADRQTTYVRELLKAAETHDFEFVVNFVLRDYDAVWEMLGANEDLTIAWRDTGLYDEEGGERPALALWREALARPVR